MHSYKLNDDHKIHYIICEEMLEAVEEAARWIRTTGNTPSIINFYDDGVDVSVYLTYIAGEVSHYDQLKVTTLEDFSSEELLEELGRRVVN